MVAAGIGRSCVMATGGSNGVVFPMDFLERFSGTGIADESPPPPPTRTEEVELSLGLSLGSGSLFRSSSSIASVFVPPPCEEIRPESVAAAIGRTCSLPVEIDEEHRKRKEMQSLKRLEAKRKRSEKRNSKADVAPEDSDGSRSKAGRSAPDAAAGTPARSRNAAAGRPAEGRSRSWAMASVGSQGSGSSGSSEEKGDDGGAMFSFGNGAGGVAPAKEMEMERSVMEEMPCVSAKGDGPNGRRIQGFLYRYKRGEEVRIVCVCHGEFLTPAEFVKHAGGGDVAHPLKHIVVNPSPAAFSSSPLSGNFK